MDSPHSSRPNLPKRARTKAPAEESHLDGAAKEALLQEWEELQELYARFSQKFQKFRQVAARHGIERASSSTSKQTGAVSAELRQEAEGVMRRSQSNGPVPLSPPPANYHGRAERERSTVAPEMIPDSFSHFGTCQPTELSHASGEVERDKSASSCISFGSMIDFTPDEWSRCYTSASSWSLDIPPNIDPRLLTTQVDAVKPAGSGTSYIDKDLQVSHGDGTLTGSK